MTLAEFFPIGDRETNRSRYDSLSPAALIDIARRYQGAQSYRVLDEIGIALRDRADMLRDGDPLKDEIIAAQAELTRLIEELK